MYTAIIIIVVISFSIECIKTEIVPLLAECEEQMSKNNTYHLVGGRVHIAVSQNCLSL